MSKPSNKLIRVRLLTDVIGPLQVQAADRARSVDSKAGFLAVTAGILVSSNVWAPHGSLGWWLTGLPLVLSLVAIGFAVMSLRVLGRPSTDAKKLLDVWLDTEEAEEGELMNYLLRSVARDTSEHEALTTRRIKHAKFGFYALLAAIVATGILFVVENSILS